MILNKLMYTTKIVKYPEKAHLNIFHGYPVTFLHPTLLFHTCSDGTIKVQLMLKCIKN